MYFLQESGEPLKLRYEKALYGPYAENLRHVLNVIKGHLITGYADGGDDPRKPLQLFPGAIEDSKLYLESKKETLARFQRVSKLVEGFESQFGLELLSTVHWVKNREDAISSSDVVEKVYAWNHRKKQFTERQISIAINTLKKQCWIEHLSFAKPSHCAGISETLTH